MTSLPITYLVPCLEGTSFPSYWRDSLQRLAAFTCEPVATKSFSNLPTLLLQRLSLQPRTKIVWQRHIYLLPVVWNHGGTDNSHSHEDDSAAREDDADEHTICDIDIRPRDEAHRELQCAQMTAR